MYKKKSNYNNHKELVELRRGNRFDSPLRALSSAGSPLLVDKLHTPDSEEKKIKGDQNPKS
jgi:hypothetical protein